MTLQIMAVMRNDQARERLSIIAWIPKENSNPPTPEPEDLIPFARLLFFSNYYERISVHGTKINPNPKPTSSPWERHGCQFLLA